MGLIPSFLVGGIFARVFVDPVLGAGLWCVLVGFVLLGAATLRLEALPRWCGVALIVCLPLAITLGDYGGGVMNRLPWLGGRSAGPESTKLKYSPAHQLT